MTTVYCTCETPIMDVEHDAGCRRCGLPVDFAPPAPVCDCGTDAATDPLSHAASCPARAVYFVIRTYPGNYIVIYSLDTFGLVEGDLILEWHATRAGADSAAASYRAGASLPQARAC